MTRGAQVRRPGRGCAARDLRVSPEHAFLLDGRLVPARLLINGGSIIQELWCHDVTYWHLELAAHGILIAEGAPAESYFDDGNGHLFDQPAVRALQPRFDRAPGSRYAAEACAPPILDAADPDLPASRRSA